jgi:hypothetical protein
VRKGEAAIANDCSVTHDRSIFPRLLICGLTPLDQVLDTLRINMLEYDSKGRNCCASSANTVPISALSPGLPELNSKRFKGTVVLIWPYSPSASQFSLLLAEPDMRLRHKHGHVRVRFSGPSAKAVAATGVTIGDAMMLTLQGAMWTKQETTKLLGENIAWELSYTDTVVFQALRNGSSLSNLDIVRTAHVPEPMSPSLQQIVPAASPMTQRSMPGLFEDRNVSYESGLGTHRDPSVEEIDETNRRKRQGKVYRNPKNSYHGSMTSKTKKITQDDFDWYLQEMEE